LIDKHIIQYNSCKIKMESNRDNENINQQLDESENLSVIYYLTSDIV